MKHYSIYKITNLVNNKIYIGKHITENLDDDYFGLSRVLNNAIKKYGIDKFKKEILYDLESIEDMNEMEKKIVDVDFVKRLDTYNLNTGGKGSWNVANEMIHNNPEFIKYRNKRIKEGQLKNKTEEEYKEYLVQKIKESFKIKNIKFDSWIGRKHREDSKRKIGEKNSIHQKGEGNSQYGTCWIYNLELKENKKIKKENLEFYINLGWIKGRKQKMI